MGGRKETGRSEVKGGCCVSKWHGEIMNSKQRGSRLLWRAVWGVREENGVGEKETRVGTSPRLEKVDGFVQWTNPKEWDTGDHPKAGEGGWVCK